MNKFFNFIFFLQLLPKTKSQNKFYGKDSEYDDEIKGHINRVDSLYPQKGTIDYINGNVEVIIPSQN